MPPLCQTPSLDLAATQDPLYPLDLAITKLSPQKQSSPARYVTIKQTPEKSVSFAADAELYYIPQSSEMTDEEYEASYMTEEDLVRISSENRKTLELMKQRQFPASQELYFRGLECSLPQSTRERRQRIKFVVYHVMEEQHRNGELSPQWIETFRSTFTDKSALFAHHMGIWDFEAMRSDMISEVRAMGSKNMPQR